MQQEWVDGSHLASSHVGTPDPRQECPPEGQRILVAWRFPSFMVWEDLRLLLTVRYWDNTEQVKEEYVGKNRGVAAFDCFEQRILTYRIQVVNGKGEIVETWEHQFWTELIDMDRRSDSVSGQSRQGSVMETP